MASRLSDSGTSVIFPAGLYTRAPRIRANSFFPISRSISGTGINLNQKQFLSDAPNPVSLTQITGETYDPNDILHQVMQRVCWYYRLLQDGHTTEIAERYKRMLYRKEGFHPYRDPKGTFLARFRDIEPSGKLVLEDQNGQCRKYFFKEVAFEH